jgi:hypothetical protein
MNEDNEREQYEQRLKRRLGILKQELADGNVQFAPDLHVVEGLKEVRYGSDGEIDLTSVDSSVRALALAGCAKPMTCCLEANDCMDRRS